MIRPAGYPFHSTEFAALGEKLVEANYADKPRLKLAVQSAIDAARRQGKADGLAVLDEGVRQDVVALARALSTAMGYLDGVSELKGDKVFEADLRKMNNAIEAVGGKRLPLSCEAEGATITIQEK